MAVLVGVVYYADDPEKKIFRKVFPVDGDPPDILDDPCWITDGCDPARTAVLEKVTVEEAAAMPQGNA